MRVADLRARWSALPPRARWPLAYAALLALAALVGWPTIGIGNGIFLAGAGCILASLGFIRHGGRRKVVVARSLQGKPLRRDWLPQPAREREIRTGVGLFLVGLALWATLLVPLAFGIVIP